MFTNSVSKIFIVLLLLAVAAVSLSFVSSSRHAGTSDRSYDGVEGMRANRTGAGNAYDALEQLRIDRSSAESVGGIFRQSQASRLWSGEVFLSENDAPDLGLTINLQSACMSEDSTPRRYSGCVQ